MVIDYLLILLFYAEEGATQNSENFDLSNITMPVNMAVLQQLLDKSGYDPIESKYLLNRFSQALAWSMKALVTEKTTLITYL